MTHLKELLSKHKYLMRRGVPWSWGHMNDGQSWYRLPCAAGRGGWRDLLREIASLLWDLAGFSLEGLGGAASTRGSSAAEKHSHIPNSSVTCVRRPYVYIYFESLCVISEIFDSSGNAVGWENLQFLPGLHKSSLGLECLNPNRKSGSNWGQVANFYLREKTVCSLDILQWNVLRRRIYFPTKKIFLFW